MFRAITACMVGNAFEWYDFALYAYFAPILSKLFFPDEDHFAGLIATYVILAAGYAIRPLGAIIFGHIGDRFGRKQALVLCIFLMTFPTFLIGLLPTYAQIGIWAPILLAALRLVQGLSVGGNLGGTVTFITEYSPNNKRGFIGSWSIVSILTGMIMGSGVAALINIMLPHEAVLAWGWRIPFLMGIFLGTVGLYMRLYIKETPEFEAHKKEQDPNESPIQYVLRSKKREMLYALMIILLNDVGFYTMFAFFPAHLDSLGYSMDQALRLNTVNMLILAILIPIMGRLSDHVGRKAVMGMSAILFIMLPYPMFTMLAQHPSLSTIWFIQCTFAVALACYFGPMSAMLVELFPTKGRYSAISLSLSTSAAVFGGTAPLVGEFLVRLTGNTIAPAYYMMAAGIITFTALMFMKDRYREILA